MIRYPRNQFVRASFQILGKLLLKILTNPEITGRESYPGKGKLIVVGNHTGVLETVLMTSYAPRPIEYLGSVDIPHEPQLALFMNLYKFIPIFRGNVSLSSMKAALEVLNQGGVIGLFPEGGIWEPAIRKAQSGVAWLSHHGQAPVLPIGFSSTAGKLREALMLKRPKIQMHIGRPIPPVKLNSNIPKKFQLGQAAQKIMEEVWKLIPDEDRSRQNYIVNEHFDFDLKIYDAGGNEVSIPHKFILKDGASLSKILYRSTLINNFRDNLNINIAPLKNLDLHPTAEEISESSGRILHYLENENPYYFTYRYGQGEGTRMQSGIQQFHNIAKWAKRNSYILNATPIRKFTDKRTSKEIIETYPTDLDKW